ncbi:hypothetical protein COCC4DRAFT_57592 [Bipolaris maydis ATCC 48331]|uniref:DUF7905 domain-containing protein n=2 Tax=Cochliobolus heterostrophus TaxID=5016 RepID=M2T1C4_COCH5|nr:uncharacterized protein COCC4DRAFT_57592 [Bipolaris maydis ATCC 48331]EMD91375.1 hypothetical protein COCHEDRAFT_1102439 [Bipolaris maydis C5]KAJ5020285.1 hypothetical protein J3E73DRAFT_201855 [Bipolaris maydis]ENI08865.1 hypothetical protein COCC4DRAFT_57592 [Bipolaris maydis ATCC 48331]KAJ5027425.1 hypothetical protein J3E73DRAFT_390527 [Bipolaris maydis]KAJ6208776.1 hypothetical protein PSV09DRAFT_1102439 [Bipolaris maydis]
MDPRKARPPNPTVDHNAFKGKKPNKVISVPVGFRRSTYAREREQIVSDVKVSTGCAVIPHWSYRRDQNESIIYQFDIFGTGTALEKAVRHINQWISKAQTKTKDSSAWAKTPAFDPNKWYYEQVDDLKQRHKQSFKEAPSEDDTLETVVHWPAELDDRDISPRDAFGNKLEFLDTLRTRNEVFITLLGNRSSDWQLKIQSHDAANLEVAVEETKNMIEKIKTEEMGLCSTNMILDDKEGMEVVFRQPDTWWPKIENRTSPRFLPSDMMDPPGSFRGQTLRLLELQTIQCSFQLALEAVRHRKGAYDLVVRLGCLSVRSDEIKNEKVEVKYSKATFLRSINGHLPLGVERWLANDTSGQQMLRSLCSSDKLLEPIKSSSYSGYRPDTLKKTRPTFRGIWIFRDPNTSPVDLPRERTRHSGRPATSGQTPVTVPPKYVLAQVDWIDDNEGLYWKDTPRFYELDTGAVGPKQHMDIKLLELGEGRGWDFALESIKPVSAKSMSPLLTRFMEGVRMKCGYNPQSADLFAEWEKSPAVKNYLVTERLIVIYSFGIKETSYKVEIARIWHTGRQPVWSLGVRHAEWANRLSELEHLPTGRKANWGNTITSFLPSDGQSSYNTVDEDEDLGLSNLDLGSDVEAPPQDGIRILIDKLLQISAVVSSVRKDEGVVAV